MPEIPIDAIRNALPSIQQGVESAFANFEADPGVGLHIIRDAYEHEREEKKESKQKGQNDPSKSNHKVTPSQTNPNLSPQTVSTQPVSASLLPPKPEQATLYYFA